MTDERNDMHVSDGHPANTESVRPSWETCWRCNYGRHLCPGCGIDVPHGTVACPECADRRIGGDRCLTPILYLFTRLASYAGSP